MRVKVNEIVGPYATTMQAGLKIYHLIEPALSRGERVELDFEGISHFATLFFNACVGILVEADSDNRVLELLHTENLPSVGREDMDVVIDYATRRRLSPRGADAMDAAFKAWSERE